MNPEILDINNLTISFQNEKEEVTAVDHISFSLKKGLTTGIVGESGSGKSVTALSILRLLPIQPASVKSGKIILYGGDDGPVDLLSLDSKQMRKIRGKRISMIFQEPMTSLNPVIRCGKQVLEAIRAHQDMGKAEAIRKALDLFREVMLPDPEGLMSAYPHELSGGQRQRVMIAMAIASQPDLLIADEPTTALDVTVQKSIIQLLKELQKKYGMAIMFITHDLGLISSIADELLVMKDGKIVESGKIREIFTHPKHSYTRSLLSCRLPQVFAREKTYDQPPMLEIKELKTYFRSRGKRREIRAVDGIDLRLYPGEVLGLVGESGCGKTTLGRTILRLVNPTAGLLRFDNMDLVAISRCKLQKLRKDIQIIFQDPYSSLNPKMTVGNALTEPMAVHHIGTNHRERKEKALQLLEKVGLEKQHYDRFPHELSGGQRQRVCIARALSVEPKFIVCDESVSALDVTIQTQVLKLLKSLKEEFGFTYIFISHDLSVVKFISDRIAVMKEGKIIETGTAEEIYLHPKSEYTKKLIDSIPSYLH